MNRMRIIIAADTYYPRVDGASYFSQRLAAELKRRGHAVLVIAPARSWRYEYFSHDGVDIFGVHSLPTVFHKDYRFTPPFLIKGAIKKEIKKFKPDIVHIQGHFFVEKVVYKIARELHIPVIGTNHFMPENLIYYIHAPKRVEEWLKRVAWKQFLAVFEHLDLVTTPTETAKKILEKIGLKKEVIPLSCGINLRRFKPENDGGYLRKRYNLPPLSGVLLCVGRLAPEKNIDCILRAVALVGRKVPIHLAVAGDGMERKSLENLAAELGIGDRVTFLGFVPDKDLPHLYNAATAFVMAGTVELQGLVMLEAMACGLPVMAVDALALPELVRHGKNGFMFEPGDFKNLAEYILRIFSDADLRASMSQKSLEMAREHDIDKTIGRFEKLYEYLIARRKTGFENIN